MLQQIFWVPDTNTNAHQSGMTEANVVLQAKIMYMEIEKKPFAFDHCWGILESSIKWQQLPGTSSRTNTPTTTTNFSDQPSTQVPNTYVSLSDDHERIEDSPNTAKQTPDSVDSPRRKRPIGRKADKASRRKKIVGDVSVRVCNLMEEFNKNFSANTKSKMEREERKLKVMEDLNKIEEDKEDERIMAMDISNMNEQRQTYYQLRKNEIMNKCLSRSSFFVPPSQMP